LQSALVDIASGEISDEEINTLFDEAVKDTVERFVQTGSPVITDGEQAKSSFATYPLSNLKNLAPDGAVIPFDDGHTRQLPRLIEGPFRYGEFAGSYLPRAKKYSDQPLKQAVISASALSLLYPADGIEGYSQEEFIKTWLMVR
jgi:5-methyltetrahydropteroyltriglutamate--homocysteine methyltransferase